MADPDVRIVKTERLLDDFLSVDEAIVEVAGTEQRRLSLERGDAAAAIVRRLDDDVILLARQFRYPTFSKGPGWVLEVAAGVVEDGEEPIDSIRRELIEELGYDPSRLDPIMTFYASPGASSERMHLFYAEVREADRVGEGGGVDADEDVEIVELQVRDLRAALDAGDLVDAKTIIAVQWLLAELG